jgi:hypothetical protein
VIPKSLVSWWNFDEQGGAVLDYRGRFQGTIINGRRTKGIIGNGSLDCTGIPLCFIDLSYIQFRTGSG